MGKEQHSARLSVGTMLATQLVLAATTVVFLLHTVRIYAKQLEEGITVRLFGTFWESGHAVEFGRNPYEIYPLVLWNTNVTNPVAEVNLNPPSLLPLFQLAARVDPFHGRLLWLIAAGAIYVIGAWIIARAARPQPLQAAWLLLFPAVTADTEMGQIYAAMFALGLCVWLALRAGRTGAAAICMALLMTIKPNFGIWCLVAIAAGHARPAIVAMGVALLLSLLPGAMYGIDVYYQWFTAVSADRHFLIPSDISMHGLFRRLGYAEIGLLSAVALGTWSLWWARRTRPTLYNLTPAAMLAGILCSPLAWYHYMVALVPFVVDRPWRPAMLVAIILTFLERRWECSANEQGVTLAVHSLAAMAPALLMLPIFVLRAQRSGASPPYVGQPQAKVTNTSASITHSPATSRHLAA